MDAIIDERDFEFIDGVSVVRDFASQVHEYLVGKLIARLNGYFESNARDCSVFASNLKVYVDENNYFYPDVSVVCKHRFPDASDFITSPDMVIEVTSKSTRHRDYSIKRTKYDQCGVKEYWIVDVDRECTVVHGFSDDRVYVFPFAGKTRSTLFPDFEFCVHDYL